MKKTYGTKCYVEWQALIYVGKAKISIPFTGGAITGNGVSPATFTTNRPVLQKIIENSAQFKSGKIYLVRSIKEASDEEQKPTAAAPTTSEAIGGNRKPSETPAAPTNPTASTTEVKKVEVSDLDAAKEYLIETFGVAVRNLRSKNDILTQAKAHKVEFVGL